MKPLGFTHFVNLEGQRKLIQEKGLSEDHFQTIKAYLRTHSSISDD
jgi:hypothetical protein